MNIIEVAITYMGAREGYPEFKKIIDDYNSNVSSKYGSYRMSYDEPWCAAFVSLCGVKAGIKNFPCSASCSDMKEKAIRSGFKVDMNPEKGAIVLFDWGDGGNLDHVGIVENFDSFNIFTIEGNTSDMVARRTHNRFSTAIKGYIHLGAIKVDNSVKQPIVSTIPVLKFGNIGPWVRALQALLIANGFDCGSYGIDGEFGNSTRNALMNFQRKNNIAVDGICGKITWKKLIGE